MVVLLLSEDIPQGGPLRWGWIKGISSKTRLADALADHVPLADHAKKLSIINDNKGPDVQLCEHHTRLTN
jgi:hypothetical protein